MQRVFIAQHSMSLGEERVYQTLWHGRESDGVFAESKRSKTVCLGYDRMAGLVRLNEKSVRVLLPKLIHKKILEVVAAENSASRLGRTYRIFSYEEILGRQRAANLTHVVKNGRAIEFVWPEGSAVGETPSAAEAPLSVRSTARSAIRAGRDPTAAEGDTPSVGATTFPVADYARVTATHAVSYSVSRLNAYPPDLAPKVRAIVSGFDDDALRVLWAKCVQQAPDCTSEEVQYCLQLKASQLLEGGKAANNAVALMLWAVPKCFEGPAALHLAYRQQRRAAGELRRQAQEEFRRQIDEYRRLIADPDTSPEDRAWYKDLLSKIH